MKMVWSFAATLLVNTIKDTPFIFILFLFIIFITLLHNSVQFGIGRHEYSYKIINKPLQCSYFQAKPIGRHFKFKYRHFLEM